MNRTWRTATAGLAATALLMTVGTGAATAQLPDLPGLDALDPETITDLLDGGGDLSPEQITDILDELGLPEGTPLDDLIEAIEDALGGGLPGGDDDGEAGGEGDDADAGATEGDGDLDLLEDLGGFNAVAEAQGLFVSVNLPSELGEPLQPLFEALGIDGTASTIEISFAEASADLQRAADGDEVDGLARALITNLLLDSGPAGSPGSCTGGETVPLPDADTPVLTITLADIDCEQTDERAFASAQVVGANVSLGNLIDLAGAEALRDALDQVLEPVNAQLLAAINDACGTLLDPITDGLAQLPILDLDGESLCAAVELNLENVLDVDVPLLDVQALNSTAEVVVDGDVVTASAVSGLASLNLAGLVCVEGTNPGDPLEFSSIVSSDGEEATADTSTTDTTARLCTNPALAQIVDVEGLLNSIEIAGTGAGDLLGEALEPVVDGVEEALATLLVDTENSLRPFSDTRVEGSGAAATSGLSIAQLQLFRGIEPLAETPLGDIAVGVVAMQTSASVNAALEGAPIRPASPGDPAAPAGSLPRTGAGAGALLGLAALGAAAAMRRRED